MEQSSGWPSLTLQHPAPGVLRFSGSVLLDELRRVTYERNGNGDKA